MIYQNILKLKFFLPLTKHFMMDLWREREFCVRTSHELEQRGEPG